MKPKFLLLVLPFILIASHAQAEPWWENSLIKQTLTQKSIDQEVCGSGIDEDGVGGDAPCPGGDSDLDGYADDVDCEPFNKFIYPEISTTCDINGGSANGWKTCQGDGTFTACVDSAVQPLCEAQGDGHCYYFDPVNGDNSNDGSYKNPWKDYVKLLKDIPNGHTPIPGDVFYFMTGVYKGSYNSQHRSFHLKSIGKSNDFYIVFKNYPGQHPVLSTKENIIDTERVSMISFTHAENIIFEGFEITPNINPNTPKTDFGLEFVVGKNHIVRNMYIHDVLNDNHGTISGCFSLNNSGSTKLRTSIIHDCYKTVTSSNVGNIFVHTLEKGLTSVMYNTIFTKKDLTLEDLGGHSLNNAILISSKAGSDYPGVTWEIAYNVLYSSPMNTHAAIRTAQYNTIAHHNIIINRGAGFHLWRSGFSIYCGMKFTNNTLINTMFLIAETPKTLHPGFDYWYENHSRRPILDPICTGNEFGDPTFLNNILYDSTPNREFMFERGLMGLFLYDPDKSYELYIKEKHLNIDYNMYYVTSIDIETNPYTVNFFEGGGDGRSKYGNHYSLNQWQTDTISKPYTYDIHSLVEDPLLKTSDGSFMPLNPNAADKGWLAGATLTPTIWDVDNDKKWSLPDVIYGLEVLSGKRK